MDLKTKWGVGAAQFGVIRNEDGSTESSTPTKADVDDAHDLNHDIDEAVLDETSANWQAKEPRWVPDPESRNVKGRTIVLCFDGTGEHFHETNSNVIKLVELLKKDDTTKQMVYYQTGIGTTTSSNLESSFIKKRIAKAMDLMFATTLEQHIRDGYEFLCQHYRRGDSINIFGFSRGAYTARALAGMIQKVGILPPGNMGMIPFAYEMYATDDEKTRDVLAPGFKATFSADVKIEFVGVWDTVKSVGLIPRRNLPFVATNSAIRFFRHALALDEHRVKFVPSYYKPVFRRDEDKLWDGNLADEEEQKPVPKDVQEKDITYTVDNEMQIDVNAKVTNSLEVWFAGSHCDVGGGSVDNTERYSLARIPLRWMIRECFRCKTGIIFNGDALHRELGISLTKDGKNIDRPEEISTVRATVPDDLILNKPPVVVKKAKTDQGSFLVTTLIKILALPFITFSWILSRFSPSEEPKKEECDGGRPKPKVAKRKKVHSEDIEELYDAIAPIHDELEYTPFWWFLELLPLSVEKELEKLGILQNWGDGRTVFKFIIDRKMIIHRSVLTRLMAKNEWGVRAYQPRARPTLGERSQRLHTRDWLVHEPNDKHWFRWYKPESDDA